MQTNSKRPKSSYLSVLLHSGAGDSYALRINLRQTYLLVASLCGLFLVLVVGTLLFFRELETNRELQERLVLATLQGKILSESIKVQGESAATAAVTALSAREVSGANQEEAILPPPQAVGSKTPNVHARVAEIGTDCASGKCSVRLVIVPTGSAAVEGGVLVALETEIPRIGTARATSSSQKRFFIYPGYQSKDELDLKEVNRLETKRFKMSRALNTNIDFQFGELLRPLAVNVFLFDTEKNLVQHERRVIDSGE